MASPAFEAAMAELLATASAGRVAVMCAEAVWWRCHRRLLADHAVLIAGARVDHLLHRGTLAGHAVAEGRRVVYDAVVGQGSPTADRTPADDGPASHDA